MKKVLLYFLFIIAGCISSWGQRYEVKTVLAKNGLYGTGLYYGNKWIIEPIYDGHVHSFGSYLNEYYYGFSKNGGPYAIFKSTGERLTPFCIKEFPNFGNFDFREGLVFCKRGNNYGVYNLNPFFEVLPFVFTYLSVDPNSQTIFLYKGDVEQKIKLSSLLNIRDNKVKELVEKAEKERTEKLLAETNARKEKELKSYTAFAKAYVEPKINEWQQKGEFEKLADYQNRVTGPNRAAMIDKLTAEAEALFISGNASLHPELKSMSLLVYDSENEVFPIKTEKFGTILVQVPIQSAPSFKQKFSNLSREDPVYFIDKDTIALRSLVFRDKASGETFMYRNGAALNYQQYEINPETYQFNVVKIQTSSSGAATALTTEARSEHSQPVLGILSPEKTSDYKDAAIIIRYRVKTFDGSVAKVKVWINGAEAEEVKELKTGTSRGVSSDFSSIEVTMPGAKRGDISNLSLQAVDGSGYCSEVQQVKLRFVGESRKSDLYLFAVGINDYKEPLQPLKSAVLDASRFISTIRKGDLSMYGQVHDKLIPQEAATRQRLLHELAELNRNVTEGAVVMFFFSGHGITDGNSGYFMTIDADPDVPDTGLHTDALRRAMERLVDDKGCRVVIFMDSCHSGKMGRRGYSSPLIMSCPQIIGFYSSQGSQESQEVEEGGIFTMALVNGLAGKAANSDHEITTETLRTYLRDEVKEKTKNRQLPKIDIPDEELVLFKVKE